MELLNLLNQVAIYLIQKLLDYYFNPVTLKQYGTLLYMVIFIFLLIFGIIFLSVDRRRIKKINKNTQINSKENKPSIPPQKLFMEKHGPCILEYDAYWTITEEPYQPYCSSSLCFEKLHFKTNPNFPYNHILPGNTPAAIANCVCGRTYHLPQSLIHTQATVANEYETHHPSSSG